MYRVLNPISHGGGGRGGGGGGNDDPPQNVLDHCAEKIWSRKMELCDFQYLSMEHLKKLFSVA